MEDRDTISNALILLCGEKEYSKAPSARGKDARKDTAPGQLFGGRITPNDEVTMGGSRSGLNGARFGENICCEDEGHRDDNGTASFKGRGRSRLVANGIRLSRRLQTARVGRRPAVVDHDNVEVCYLWAVCRQPPSVSNRCAIDRVELFARSRHRNGCDDRVEFVCPQ